MATPETVLENGHVGGDPAQSLKDRLAERHKALQVEQTFTLPIPGYADLLIARYKVLDYHVLRKIGEINQRLEGTPDGDLAVAADSLVHSCVDILEVLNDGSYRSTGQRWSLGFVRDWLGVDLPENATVRDAVQAALPSTQLMLHFREYDQECTRVVPQIQQDLVGESEPSVEG